MDDSLRKLAQQMDLNDPSTTDVISLLQAEFGFLPPRDYVEFIRQANGGEGNFGICYLVLWKVEDLKTWNEGYLVQEFAPGLVLFGSDGGDTAYAFDTRHIPAQIVEVPFIGMGLSETKYIGESFDDFLRHLV